MSSSGVKRSGNRGDSLQEFITDYTTTRLSPPTKIYCLPQINHSSLIASASHIKILMNKSGPPNVEIMIGYPNRDNPAFPWKQPLVNVSIDEISSPNIEPESGGDSQPDLMCNSYNLMAE